MATMELVLVRHGETQSNKDHTIQGHTDTPLSSVGIAQAERVAAHLANEHFDLAISSDLQRAKKTGELICDKNASISNLDSWPLARERCFGNLEGKSADTMMSAIKGLSRSELSKWGPEGGESGDAFRSRIREFIKQLAIRAGQIQKDSMSVLVATHGGFIKDLNIILVDEHSCQLPEGTGKGEHARISPNTGVSRYTIKFDRSSGDIESAVCTQLYFKGHLEGMKVTEAILYGV